MCGGLDVPVELPPPAWHAASASARQAKASPPMIFRLLIKTPPLEAKISSSTWTPEALRKFRLTAFLAPAPPPSANEFAAILMLRGNVHAEQSRLERRRPWLRSTQNRSALFLRASVAGRSARKLVYVCLVAAGSRSGGFNRRQAEGA